jgi:hypothetical protein
VGGEALDDADRCLTAEIIDELLLTRGARANPRVVKRKMSVEGRTPSPRNAPIIEHRPIIVTLK